MTVLVWLASCPARLTGNHRVRTELGAVYSRAMGEINRDCEDGTALTCDGMSIAGRLAPSDEDDISLARVCVVVFKEEEIVDTVIAQSRGLDHDTKWTS